MTHDSRSGLRARPRRSGRDDADHQAGEIPTKLVWARPGPPGSREFLQPEVAKEVLTITRSELAQALADRLTAPVSLVLPV
jgi:hypothetical protein